MTRLAIAAVLACGAVAGVLAGVLAASWLVRRIRKPPSAVTPQWLNEHVYDRRGDGRFK